MTLSTWQGIVELEGMQTRDTRCSLPAVAGVKVFSRRKAGEKERFPNRGRLPIRMDLDSIRLLFGMRQPEAAKRLAISLTALKQVCRKLGIIRWPYHRPYKRGSHYQPSTRQDAIEMEDEPNAPKLHTQPQENNVDTANLSDLADSDSGASTLHDSSHPKLAAEGTSSSDCDTKGSSSSNAATIATHTTNHHTAPLHFLPEEIPFMALDAYDHDLRWLVSSGNSDSHPLVEDLAFDIVWRERNALEAQKAERERSACLFNFTRAPCLFLQ